MSDVRCPYSGTEQLINHEGDYGYEGGEEHEQACEKCGKPFIFPRCIGVITAIFTRYGE